MKSVHAIDLPRPRDILNVRTEQAFHDIYSRFIDLVLRRIESRSLRWQPPAAQR